MSTAAPARSAEQRLAALAKANRIRLTRSAVKRDVRAGDIQAWPLIDDPPAELENMHVADLLVAVPKMGPTKVRRLLLRLSISHTKTLGGLSARQRGELVDALRGSAR